MKKSLLGLCFILSLTALPSGARPLVAIRGVNQLVQFDSSSPNLISSAPNITGLVSGDEIRAIDFRPANGLLYGLGINGSTGRIYLINPTNGQATQVGPAPFSTSLDSTLFYGFDFDPNADRIRIVNSSGQNLRVHPDTGALTNTDTNLSVFDVVATAYDRNDRNPGTLTTLFGINFNTDALVRIGGVDGTPSPNAGSVTTIGGLGLTTANRNIGFEIAEDGIAYASMPTGAGPTYRLYTINLGTGTATPVNTIGTGNLEIRGLAAFPSSVANINSGEFFTNIQAAVNDAQTLGGHTIVVNAGTFTETVTVTKSLNILGARTGMDARDPLRGTNESVVKGTGGKSSFHVTANEVAIDGFIVEDNTNSTDFGAGIVLAPNTTEAKIRNNIIRNNVNGLFLSGNSPKVQTVIERNLFSTNNQSGGISGIGIYADVNKSGSNLSNVLINDNTFIGNTEGAIELQMAGAASHSRMVIANNIMTGNGNGVVLIRATASIITRNTITGSLGAQILFVAGNNGVTVTENVLQGGNTTGIRVEDIFNVNNANITATCNRIEGNAQSGLHIDVESYTGTLDATGNWWGSPTGPTIATNPGGMGQGISDPQSRANFSGFLVSGDDQQPTVPGFQCYPSITLYGVDGSNNLLRFDSAAPGTVLSSVAITGMQAGENILGIDFRPTTGELFALGSNNRLYVLDPASGAATLRAPLTAASTDTTEPFVALSGTGYGVAFNPVADLAGNTSLRVVSTGDQNLRINANNGEVTTDAAINGPGTLSIDAVAYTNVDYDPATNTVLLGYDFSGDNLVQIIPPNNGTCLVIGLSGVTAINRVNFDIQTVANSRNIPFASIQVSGTAVSKLYLVNLIDGLLVPVGDIGGTALSRGMAAAPVGGFQLSSSTYSIGEAGPFATITINRLGGGGGTASVRFRAADGTANAPDDYTSLDQVVTFADGETSKTIDIPIVNDSADEFNETVSLSLSEPGGGALLTPGLTTAVLTITDDDVATPVLTTQPSAPSAAVGEAIFDIATLSGGSSPSGTITFQLFGPNDNSCSGAPIFTSVVPVNGNGNYVSGSFTPTTPGNYRWVVTYSGEADHNAPVSTACGAPNQTIGVTATTLGNISTRLRVETGDNVLIGGFIITGTQPKKVLIRAIGPSLAQFFSGVLENPTLELYQGNTLLESNDNWVDAANKQEIVDTTIAPTNDLEAAILVTLPANNTGYTAVVRGFNGGTGIGVVEAYDLDRLVDSELANISTRGFVQTGDNVLIAGTIVVGQNSQRVLIRAIGPSLAQFFSGVLENPTLELRDSNGGLLQANDNWVDSPDKQAITDTTIAPTNDFESAILAVLPANNASYTAIVRGVNDATGIAVVEVYALD